MRTILRTMDLPGKSAALCRPRKSPIVSFAFYTHRFKGKTNYTYLFVPMQK